MVAMKKCVNLTFAKNMLQFRVNLIKIYQFICFNKLVFNFQMSFELENCNEII
jgi:hypothetical protein